MFPLLLPFLADTVVAPMDNTTLLRIHEWGVVTFTSVGSEVTGVPGDTYGYDPFGMVCVDAPVVWFHGSPFTGTFTATAGMGFISTAYPTPSVQLEGDAPPAVSWHIDGRLPEPYDEAPVPSVPEGTPFQWAMDFWRDVPCHDLYDADGNYLDRFLYYETAIPDGIHTRMNTVVEDGRQLAGYFSPEGLLIATGDEPRILQHNIIPLPVLSDAIRPPLERDEILEKICDWAGGNLKSQEIAALWNTWEPFFSERPAGELWLLFPLPPATVEGISTLSLAVEQPLDLRVEYHRLFLGLVRVE